MDDQKQDWDRAYKRTFQWMIKNKIEIEFIKDCISGWTIMNRSNRRVSIKKIITVVMLLWSFLYNFYDEYIKGDWKINIFWNQKNAIANRYILVYDTLEIYGNDKMIW